VNQFIAQGARIQPPRHAVHVGIAREVRRHGFRRYAMPGAQLRGQFFQAIRTARHQHQAVTILRDLPRKCCADPA